jgi:peroxiredoxin
MTLEIGALAPEFALEGIDGRSYSLREALPTGPTLLLFFKANCSACELAFPYMNRLASVYSDGWQLWAVAQEPPDRAREYAGRYSMRYPVLPDTLDYNVSKQYDPPAAPTFFLVGPDGRVAFSSHGFSKDDLNEMSRLIAERLGVEPQVVAPPDDGQPAFRPG